MIHTWIRTPVATTVNNLFRHRATPADDKLTKETLEVSKLGQKPMPNHFAVNSFLLMFSN